MDDRMKVIREALVMAGKYVGLDVGGSMTREEARLITAIKSGIAALDSLAVETSEDAREFCRALSDKIKIIKLGPGGYSSIATLGDEAAARITARDERVKAEERKACADRAELEKVEADETKSKGDYAYNRGIEDAISAIMGTEVEG